MTTPRGRARSIAAETPTETRDKQCNRCRQWFSILNYATVQRPEGGSPVNGDYCDACYRRLVEEFGEENVPLRDITVTAIPDEILRLQGQLRQAAAHVGELEAENAVLHAENKRLTAELEALTAGPGEDSTPGEEAPQTGAEPSTDPNAEGGDGPTG